MNIQSNRGALCKEQIQARCENLKTRKNKKSYTCIFQIVYDNFKCRLYKK